MKLIVLSFLLMVSFHYRSVAQISNQERLVEIEQEIREAVNQGDYALAARLKQEKDIRIQIKDAIERKDFERAAELKEQLEAANNQKENTPQSSIAPVPKTEDTERTPSSTQESPARERWVPLNNLTWYRATKSGVYFNGLIGVMNHYSMQFSRSGDDARGGRIGYKFFFGEKESRSRAGIDLMFLSILGSDTRSLGNAFQISVVNVGGTWAGAVTRKSGVEFTLKSGPNIFYNYNILRDRLRMGFNVAPEMKIRLSFVDIGATVIYSHAVGTNLETLYIGALGGFKF